jgi:hypothetical protein
MANFTRGHNWTVHETIAPGSYNNHVDLATLSNVWNNVLNSSAIRLPWLVDATGSPITGDIRVPITYLLEFYFSSQWNVAEGDVQSITLQNNSAVNLLIGDVVCQDNNSAGGFLIPTIKDSTDTSHPIGVLLDNVNAGASGRVAYHGPVLVKPNGALSYNAGNVFTLVDSAGGPPVYSQAAATSATPTGGGALYPEDDRVFGIFLTSGAGTSLTQAYIWK